MIKINSRIKFFLSALFVFVSLIVYGQAGKSSFKFKTIVIDAGHGGKDPGAHGSYSLEKDVALAVAKKVQALLNDDMPEITVIMTRTTDKFIPLNERSEIANRNNANLFISIHCN